MCNRFSFIASKEDVEDKFNVSINNNFRPNYNIAPTQHAYVITNENRERLQYLTWGLIPSWSRDGRNTGKLINARKETISTQTSFRMPIRQRRCLVLADSFYEWKREGTEKIPYRIKMKEQEVMVMAGIWDEWYKDDYALRSFSIVTTPANEEMKEIYDRMPVILKTEEQQKKWLDQINLDTILKMLDPLPNDSLEFYKISRMIDSTIPNTIDLHRAVS